MSLCHWFFVVTHSEQVISMTHSQTELQFRDPKCAYCSIVEGNWSLTQTHKDVRKTCKLLQTYKHILYLTDDHSSNWSHRALTMFALWGPFFVPQARNMNIRLTGPVNKLFPLCSTSLWCPLMFYFWFVFPFFFFFLSIFWLKKFSKSAATELKPP